MTPEEFLASIEGKTLDELRQIDADITGALNTGADEIRSLADMDEITADDDTKLTGLLESRDAKLAEREVIRTVLGPLETRAKKVEEIRSQPNEIVPGYDNFNFNRQVDPFAGDVNRLGRDELRDRALRVVESNGKELAARQGDHLDSLIRRHGPSMDGGLIAKRILITERSAYHSAFMKGVNGITSFSPDEARALDEFRAMNEDSNSGANGGYGIPVLIDPSIIITSGAADAPIMDIARTVTITTEFWKGVTGTGATWSYDAEASAVSDDSPTLTQPVIQTYKAAGWIPYSLEIGMDYPNFAEEMSMVLGQGYIDLIASNSMTGSGSSQPKGIFTAIAAVSGSRVQVTTKGAITAVDIRKAWAALPERYRSRATWAMSIGVENAIQNVATALSLGDYTSTTIADGSQVLTGRPVITSDYAPSFAGTTGIANYAVVGDFSNFVIVQRAGMTVELVPHLFDQASGRPTGQRGWYAYSRHGFDAVNTNAFRLLSNT